MLTLIRQPLGRSIARTKVQRPNWIVRQTAVKIRTIVLFCCSYSVQNLVLMHN
jgi:hypothetical protein